MTRLFRRLNDNLLLSGDTYAIKENLKAMGGRWDSTQKCWRVPDAPAFRERVLSLGFRELPSEEVIAGGPVVSTVEKTWSVREYVGHAAAVVEQHLGACVWLVGELTSCKQSNGHMYFELSDSDENAAQFERHIKTFSINCCLWAGKVKLLEQKYGKLPLQDGMRIKIFVHCELRREGARLNVIVDDIDVNFTLGDLALQRQRTIAELKRRGLYDRNRTQPLPKFPLRIGLITSQGSRAESDFLDELKNSGFSFVVTLFDSHMQGEATSSNVCAALTQVSARTEIDCVVITRGGGSRLDLRFFDDLEICKAIAYCPMPVITAIGHFEDVSIADEVAWRAEKTPTGAARFLTATVQETLTQLENASRELGHKALRRLQRESENFARIEQVLQHSVARRLGLEKERLSAIERALQLLQSHVTRTLERGFALVETHDGKILKAEDIKSFHSGDNLIVKLYSQESLKPIRVRTEFREIIKGD